MSRPITRGDCENGPRPCPWYTCKYHLGTDIHGDVLRHRDLSTMTETCCLDVAEEPHSIESVAEYIGLTVRNAYATQVGAMKAAEKAARKIATEETWLD